MTARRHPQVRQHQSHLDLLVRADTAFAPRAEVDAIIVPTARRAASLCKAMAVAKDLDVHLLLLCSKQSDAASAALLAKREGVRATALNVDLVPKHLVPPFATDELLRFFGRFTRQTDVSFKRNLGLLIAALAGWKRFFFLDDDIVVPDSADLTAAAGLVDDYAVAGLANAGMPDNSVVCHALRDVGVAQHTFIGGGALAVGEAAFGSFFPNIYNEDWFFLLDGMRMRRSAVIGTAIQQPYDPYRDSRRARGEELGDTLAEGLFSLLDDGLRLADADERYWREFLPARRRIIRTTIGLVEASAVEPAQKDRMLAALRAAIGRSKLITPDLCVRYLHAWQADSLRWQRHLRTVRRERRAAKDFAGALTTLKLSDLAQPGVPIRD
ncbi:hypothetical protein AB0F52_31220 [Amycolatopsis sp. NPDC024027]|uniref:hypothetical protein n=1 Tax=Amycolatopsis sp. NPDC024027 TaxID=3154327 RepID=UPI00340348BC